MKITMNIINQDDQDCINEGVLTIKRDWSDEDGIVIEHNNKTLVIQINEDEVDLMNTWQSIAQIKNRIITTANNFCIPYTLS